MKNCKKGAMLRKIRKDYGLTQSQLACKGMDRTVICKIENGEKELDYRKAFLLSKRFEELGYKVSSGTLLGIPEENIDNIIENFIKNPSSPYKLNKLIEGLYDDKAVEIILRVIERLKEEDIYKNAEYILTYILELTQYGKLDNSIYLKLNLYSIMANLVLGNYGRVISIYEVSVMSKIEEVSKEDRIKCYLNVVTAYYNNHQYLEALDILNKTKKMKMEKYSLKILTLEAYILTVQHKFKDSIKVNQKIIEKAIKANEKNYIANCYSNIAYMLIEEGKLSESKRYIDNAFLLFNDIDGYYKMCVYDNKFYLELKSKKADIESFKKLIRLCIDFHDEKRKNEAIEQFIDYNINNNADKEIFKQILKFLTDKNIKLDASLKIKIMEHIYVHSNLFSKDNFLGQIILQ